MKSNDLKFAASLVVLTTVTPLVLAQSPAKPLVFESVFDKYQRKRSANPSIQKLLALSR